MKKKKRETFLKLIMSMIICKYDVVLIEGLRMKNWFSNLIVTKYTWALKSRCCSASMDKNNVKVPSMENDISTFKMKNQVYENVENLNKNFVFTNKLYTVLERRSNLEITKRILNNICFYIRNKLWILLANRSDWWQEHSVQFVVTVRPSIHINNMKFVSILRHREKLRNFYLDTFYLATEHCNNRIWFFKIRTSYAVFKSHVYGTGWPP